MLLRCSNMIKSFHLYVFSNLVLYSGEMLLKFWNMWIDTGNNIWSKNVQIMSLYFTMYVSYKQIFDNCLKKLEFANWMCNQKTCIGKIIPGPNYYC